MSTCHLKARYSVREVVRMVIEWMNWMEVGKVWQCLDIGVCRFTIGQGRREREERRAETFIYPRCLWHLLNSTCLPPHFMSQAENVCFISNFVRLTTSLPQLSQSVMRHRDEFLWLTIHWIIAHLSSHNKVVYRNQYTSIICIQMLVISIKIYSLL